MGAHPYWYAVKYRPDVEAALHELREREFRAGRYNPVMPFLDFPVTQASPAPGAQHRTIEDALEDSDADGTRSILDISGIADEPDFGVACPLAPEVLQDLYGTHATEPGGGGSQHGFSGGCRARPMRLHRVLYRRHSQRAVLRWILV